MCRHIHVLTINICFTGWLIIFQFFLGTRPSRAPSSRSNAKLNFESIVAGDNSHWITQLLDTLCDSNVLADQLHYLRNLDVNTRALLQNTVFESEMLIAYTRICHISSCCTDCFPRCQCAEWKRTCRKLRCWYTIIFGELYEYNQDTCNLK